MQFFELLFQTIRCVMWYRIFWERKYMLFLKEIKNETDEMLTKFGRNFKPWIIYPKDINIFNQNFEEQFDCHQSKQTASCK